VAAYRVVETALATGLRAPGASIDLDVNARNDRLVIEIVAADASGDAWRDVASRWPTCARPFPA
jgi:hypothetical protein